MADLDVSRKHSGAEFPLRWLLGDGGRGGAVDLFMMKYKMLEFLLSTHLDLLGLPSHVKEKMREVLANHISCRKFLNPHVMGAPGDTDGDAPRAFDDARGACEIAADGDAQKPDMS